MAKISSHGATTLAQVKAHKLDPDAHTHDGKIHLTLTATTDGRVLRQFSFRYRSSLPGSRAHYSRSNNTLIMRVTPEYLARGAEAASTGLERLARKWGYTIDE
jgi:hypothetical protein